MVQNVPLTPKYILHRVLQRNRPSSEDHGENQIEALRTRRGERRLACKKRKIPPPSEHAANLKMSKAAGIAKHVNPVRRNGASACADINDDEIDEGSCLPPPASGNKIT